MKKIINQADIKHYVNSALKEDIGKGDVTTNFLIPEKSISKAHILIKEDGILCGLDFCREVFSALDEKIKIKTKYQDGDKVKRHDKIIFLEGRTRPLLTGERVALNLLGYLSGIASNAYHLLETIKPLKVKILDTRKTIPGLRKINKYALRCGGGSSHRFDLHEMVLIKDNHRGVCHPQISIKEAIGCIRKKTKKKIEIEVDTLPQFKEALAAHPDIILLDNMNIAQLKKAVALNKKIPADMRPLLEASGGITIKNIKSIARTGIDRISTGSLTHTIKMLDFSMEIFK